MGKYQRRDKIARLISWGHWFTFANIILCLFIGLLYIEAAPKSPTAIGNLYMLVSWIGHFAFLPFVFFIILIFPFCLVVPYSKILRGFAALVTSFGLIALIADAIFFRQYGYHLNTYSLAQMTRDAEAVFTGASFVIISAILFGFLLIVGIQLLLANLAWKRLDELQRRKIGAPVTALFVLCFFISHSVHVWADAVLYDPITQQDDMFPLSYPATAKTLMAKHGVIDVESYQARQQMLMATDQIKLNYPQQPLLCSKTDFQQSTTLILFERASAEIQNKLEQLTAESQLERANIQLLAHPSREGGLFQVLYGLPDFYQESIERQQLKPAYLKPLNDFNFDVNWYHSRGWNDALRLSQFDSNWSSQELENFNALKQNQINVVLIAEGDLPALDDVLKHTRGHQLLITSLSPERNDELLGNKQFALKNMQVPLWERNYELANQPIAGLMDIMPTILESRISCAGSHKNYTNGESLQTPNRRWPLVETYSPYIVIYDEKEITILDNSGQFSVYNSNDFELKKQAEPPVPVLIDALKDLKRFSKTGENR
ncbi:DUF3413 domain-containing protein [Idiomarina sp. HP20-50]|uniref:DUF3413 domain-containing protein n=1 Tax=Idiomarina sp. HP20-50 TaxID=3070813 RepID=UPI00294A9E79|nr:DUF3413 domain-containing protein [Idiomarina sp. HP20-50]MDV6315190.1 DUF3413 domain-containing protein [Idiomarina sp. HP20-50]